MQPFIDQLVLWKMEFPERLARLRKERGFTQQALADLVGVHVLQIRRYEGAHSQPTLEVIKRLAQALRVSADALVFDVGERGPDEELRLQFEALAAMPAEEKELAKAMLEAIILKNQVAGAVRNLSVAPTAKAKKPARERARA